MKFSHSKSTATRIKVNLGDNIENYAKSFLAIYNNVKNDKDLLKMYNNYDNDVYVVCESEVQDAAVEFLAQFGKVVKVEPVEIVRTYVDNFNYRDDIDVEFLDIEE